MRQPKKKQFAPRVSLQRLTNKSYSLKALLKQAGSRLSLTDLFNQSVPSLFKNKFQVNNLTEQTLTLTCHSASLMTRLRFSEDSVIEQFNLKIKPKHIKHIKIKIRPKALYQNSSQNSQTERSVQKKPTNHFNKEKLSKKNAQLLFEEAEHTDDIQLKSILMRLAKHSD